MLQDIILRTVTFLAYMAGKALPDQSRPYRKRVLTAVGSIGYLLALFSYPNELVVQNAKRIFSLTELGKAADVPSVFCCTRNELFNCTTGAQAQQGKMKDGSWKPSPDQEAVYKQRLGALVNAANAAIRAGGTAEQKGALLNRVKPASKTSSADEKNDAKAADQDHPGRCDKLSAVAMTTDAQVVRFLIDHGSY